MTTPPDYTSKQIELERECLQSGVIAYRRKESKLKGRGLESMTDPAGALLKQYVDPMGKGVVAWVLGAYARKGVRPVAAPLLANIDPDVAALLALKEILNGISQKRTIQDVATAIGRAIELEQKLTRFADQEPHLYKKVYQYVNESPLGFNPEYRARVLAYAAKKYTTTGIISWTKDEMLHVGVALLDLAIKFTGLVTTVRAGRNLKSMRVFVVGTPQLETWLNAQHHKCSLLQPSYLPMLVPPKDWTSLNDGGYLTPELAYPMIRGRTRQIESELTQAKMPLVYNAVNTMQRVPYNINSRVLATLTILWERGHPIPESAARVDRPRPPKPGDYATNPDARKRWKLEAKETYMENQRERGKRLNVTSALSIARRFEHDTLYFPHMLDFRGRMYAVTQYLSPQGSDVSRGLLLFGNGKPLGKSGLKWLDIHAANTFGVDKVSEDDQLRWAQDHRDEMIRCASDPLTHKFWHDADKPVQFLAACFEIADAHRDGKPDETYISHLPIMVDGTCNGIQHLAAMSRDRNAGRFVNLIPGPKPEDIYGVVAEETKQWLVRYCGTASSSGPSVSPSPPSSATSTPPPPSALEIAQGWLGYGIDRSTTKRPTMIQPYGGTLPAVEEYTVEWINKKVHKTKQPHPWGRYKRRAARFAAGAIWESMSNLLAGPRSVMEWTKALAKIMTKAGKPMSWHTPSGFCVLQQRFDRSNRTVKTRLGDKIVKVTMSANTNKLNSRRQTQALAPNFIHSLDAAALHLTINTMIAAGITDIAAIHDSYGTHACDMDFLSCALRKEFVQMYESRDILNDMRTELVIQINGAYLPPPPPRGTLDISEVLRSRYFFA